MVKTGPWWDHPLEHLEQTKLTGNLASSKNNIQHYNWIELNVGFSLSFVKQKES